MADLMICVPCKKDPDRDPFIVTHDEIGVALMTEHLRNEHGAQI